MIEAEILLALIKDYYVLKAAYKKEQDKSSMYRRWWNEQEAEKIKISSELKELQNLVSLNEEMNKPKKK